MGSWSGRVVGAGLAWAAGSAVPTTASAGPTVPHHCAADEVVVLTCEVDGKPGKVLSLCMSPGATATQGWFAYRYGALGKVELEYPAKKTPAGSVFQEESMLVPPGGWTSWAFTNADHRYVVTSGIHAGEEYAGVRISPPSGAKIELSCGRLQQASGPTGLKNQLVVRGKETARAALAAMDAKPACADPESRGAAERVLEADELLAVFAGDSFQEDVAQLEAAVAACKGG